MKPPRVNVKTALLLALFSVISRLHPDMHLVASQSYDRCDIEEYYENLITVEEKRDREKMHALVKTTHRNVVPYTSSSSKDVWDAMLELDGDSTKSKVNLIYKGVDTDFLPRGTSDTWNREHVWPKSLGVGDNGPDYSDLHHLRPSDATINSSRGNRYFSSCGIVNSESSCVSPAQSEADSSTERDSTTFSPPTSVRGDLSRALFYMALRYDGDDDNDGIDLVLSDCPEGVAGGMGYLSQLLKWHEEDPVDDEEIMRNNKVCGGWQGNRNPFVDFPDLVSFYYGQMKNPNEGGLGYDCVTPEEPPQSSPSVQKDDCRAMLAGNVMITGFQSQNPETVAIVALNDIPAGMEIFMTDNAWTGNEFKTNEGTKKIVVPSQGIKAGTIFGYGHEGLQYSSLWQAVQGSFDLTTKGDNIYIYCITADENPNILSGLIYSESGWSEENDTSLTTSESVRPKSLPFNCAISLSLNKGYIYQGTRNGSQSEILEELSNTSYWYGSDDMTSDVVSSQSDFTVDMERELKDSSASCWQGFILGGAMLHGVVLMLVLIII